MDKKRFSTEDTSPDQMHKSEAGISLLVSNRVKQSQFLSDVHEVVPKVNEANAKNLLIAFLIFLVFLIIFSVLVSVFFSFEGAFDRFERWGYLGVFIANLLSSGGVIFPTPPGLALTMAVASVSNIAWVAIAAAAGSILGECTAYYVGYGGRKFISPENFKAYQIAKKWMERYGGPGITFFAFFPLFMFDFIGIAAGAFKFPVRRYLLFVAIGRIPRAFIEAYVGMSLVQLVMS